MSGVLPTFCGYIAFIGLILKGLTSSTDFLDYDLANLGLKLFIGEALCDLDNL